MPHEDRHIRSYDYDLTDDPASEIVSLPASVQRKMDRAASLLRDGDVPEGLSIVHQAGVELARTDPLVFAGLFASQLGVSGIRFSRRGGDRTTVEKERHAFGVRIGREAETTTREFYEERSVDFGFGQRFGKGAREW